MDFEYASLQRKAKTYTVVAATVLACFMLFLGYALYEVRINGPLYDHIRRDHDLVADALPPTLYIVGPHLDVTEALVAAERQSFEHSLSLARRALSSRALFEERMTHWAHAMDTAALRALVTQEAREPAQRYFEVVAQSLLPALDRHDMAQARAVYDGRLQPLFEKHRALIDRAMEAARRESARSEADAAGLVTLIQSAVVLGGLLLSGVWWWSWRRLWVQPLLHRMAEVQTALHRLGRLDYDTPVEPGPADEFGQILSAIEAMRTRLRIAMQDLDDQRVAALTAERTKTEFLANMSHEIRTPMNAILGLTELTLRSGLEDKQREWLTRSHESAQALLHMLEQILDLSHIDTGEVKVEAQAFSLQSLLDQITAIVSGRAVSKGLAWHVHAQPGMPARFIGDARRIKQVLVNLCNNAVKFTDQGQIDVTVCLPEQEADRCTLRFVVQDTGIGMSQAQIDQLFQPFAQADASLTRRHGGPGLGLVICKRLVQAMGGELRVSSEAGRGSAFTVTLPVWAAQEASPEPVIAPAQIEDHSALRAEMPAHPQWAALKGKRVLLVEDNDINQMLASELLRDVAGMQVTVADGGLSALASLEAHAFDVVLMDIQMPGLDGYETTRRLRAMGLSADQLPVIAMTAHATEQDRTQCLAVGMNDYISKPVMPAVLFSTLQKWLRPEATA
ncbi:MAG: response regulator [Acidobacteriota bacterium]